MLWPQITFLALECFLLRGSESYSNLEVASMTVRYWYSAKQTHQHSSNILKPWGWGCGGGAQSSICPGWKGFQQKTTDWTISCAKPPSTTWKPIFQIPSFSSPQLRKIFLKLQFQNNSMFQIGAGIAPLLNYVENFKILNNDLLNFYFSLLLFGRSGSLHSYSYFPKVILV